jgi:hypothetical protein
MAAAAKSLSDFDRLPTDLLPSSILLYLTPWDLGRFSRTCSANLTHSNDGHLWSECLNRDFHTKASANPKSEYQQKHAEHMSAQWKGPRTTIAKVEFISCGTALRLKGRQPYFGGLRVKCVMVG